MATKTVSIKLEATQFKKGDKTFNGGTVRNLPKGDKKIEYGKDEEPFAIVNAFGGTTLRLDEGMWLVTYPDGKQEAWSDERMKAAGKDGGEDARLEDADIKAEAMDKLVVDYKEHNPKPGTGNAPVTGTEESKHSKSKGK